MPAGNMLEAFFVSLGWDTRDFDRGRKQISSDFGKTKDDARKTANDIEAAGKQAASFFRSLRNETVGLFLAFQGASSLKSFLGDIITTAASTDRLAKNMGVARNELYAWQNLAKTNGGTPADARNALGTMADQIQSWKLGISTGNEQNLAGLGLTRNDYTTPDHMLEKISEAAGKMDRATFSKRLGLLGFSPEMIDLLSKGRGELEKQLEVQRKLASLTADDAKAAEDFQKALAELQTSLTGTVLPAITGLLEWFRDFLEVNKDLKLTVPEVSALFGLLALAIAPAAVEMAIFVFAALGAINIMRRLRGEPPIVIKIPRFGGIGGMGTAGGDGGDGRPTNDKGQYIGGNGMFNLDSIDKAAGRGGGSGAASSVEAFLIGRGVSPQVARGVAAGVYAEGGSPTARNPTSGAFGIGQWLGGRKKGLLQRYGPNPNMQQQMEYLLWELRGGDHGGASVLGSGSAGAAGYNYITKFMRPAAGAETIGDLSRVRQFLGSRAPVGGGAGGGGGSTVTIGAINVTTPDADSFAKKDLEQKLRSRGLVVQAARGMSR